MRPERQSGERIDEAALIQDAWYVLARASTDDAPRTLAAAQDAVFRRYRAMAHRLANETDFGDRPVDPSDAERAAELGLAQAVLGWRRPDSGGFALFASVAIAAQPDRLPTTDADRSATPTSRWAVSDHQRKSAGLGH